MIVLSTNIQILFIEINKLENELINQSDTDPKNSVIILEN